MNTKKRRSIIVGLFILISTIVVIYTFSDGTPAPFPSNHQLVNEMNGQVPKANVEIIQDSIYLDEKNVFVPFITKNKAYGMSFWVWKNRKWHVAEVDVSDMLKLWKLKNNEPSSYRFVWNFPPDEKMSFKKVFFIKDRMHSWSNEKHHYEPRIQMEEKIENEGKSYGVLSVSKDWVIVMNEINKSQSNQQQDIFSSLFYTQSEYYFSWNTYDRNNQEYFLNSLSHSFSWHSDINLGVEYVFYEYDGQLEYPD